MTAPPEGPPVAAQAAVVAAVLLAAGWLAAAHRLRRRGDAWPVARDVSFLAGLAGLAAAVAVPLPAGPFTAHMARHLLLGMACPLLLVLARPVTLALRALPAGSARRRVLAVVRSRPTGWLVYPPVAAVLDAGGLWALYRTPLFAAVHGGSWPHLLVSLHVLAAGLAFSAAVCQLEPLRHPHGLPLRAACLVAAGAAHAVLAKTLYGAPPPGTGATAGHAAVAGDDLRAGAQLMYYGGDAVEVGLAVVLALSWYAAAGRGLARARRRGAPAARARTAATVTATTSVSPAVTTSAPGGGAEHRDTRRTGRPAAAGACRAGAGRRRRSRSRA